MLESMWAGCWYFMGLTGALTWKKISGSKIGLLGILFFALLGFFTCLFIEENISNTKND